MSRLFAPSQLATAHLVLSALVLLWDLSIAGRTAQLRATPGPMAVLSAVTGLLLVPALVVLLVTDSALTGRSLYQLAWLWPLTVALVAAQAIYAVARRLVAAPIGVPIAAYDTLLALVAAGHWLAFRGAATPEPLQVFTAAERGAIALSAQPLALMLPYYMHLPVLAPATPGRRGVETILRTLVAAIAAAWGALIVVDIPNATRTVESYRRYATQRLQERPDSDFAVGLKVFPTLTKGPPPLSLQSDLDLADSIGAEVLSVYVAPAGANGVALDSLQRSLEDQRSDKQLIVALDLGREEPVPAARRAQYLAARAADVERLALRLRPDYVVPVLDPTGSAARAIGPVSAAGWSAYLRRAADAAHRVAPRTRVMAHVGGFGARDSAIYAWSIAPGSPVDAVGFSLLASLGGADALDARMRAADGWIRASRGSKELWVLEAGGFPLAQGEMSQARAIWGALAWATSRSAVKGVVVLQAGDYGAPIGLRAIGGRWRPAAITVQRAISALEGS